MHSANNSVSLQRNHYKNNPNSHSLSNSMANSKNSSIQKQNSPEQSPIDCSGSASSFTTVPLILTPISPPDHEIDHTLPTPLSTESKINLPEVMTGISTSREALFVDQRYDHQNFSHGPITQLPDKQNLVLAKGKSRRKLTRDLNSLQRRSSMRRPSCSKDSADQRTFGLLKQRKQSQRYSRYLANKPLPYLYLSSSAKINNLIPRDTRLEFNIADKPLPPVPAQNNTIEKDFICDVFESSLSKEEIGCLSSGKEEILNHSEDISIDQYYPLTDESMKSELMEIQQEGDKSHLVSIPLAKSELEPSKTLILADSPPLTADSTISRLNDFRFPIKSSPTVKAFSEKQNTYRHNHHQSLPYNRIYSRSGSRTTEPRVGTLSGITKHSRNSSLASTETSNNCSESLKLSLVSPSSTSQCTAVVSQSEKIENQRINMGKQMVGPERLKRRSSLSLKRSQSCNNKTHRPSLSLNSTKKALLSLQDRRIYKPNAKVHRLPDIKTSTPPTNINDSVDNPLQPNSSCTSEDTKESPDVEPNSVTSGNSEEIDFESQETPQSIGDNDTDIQMNSREVIDETKSGVTESYISHQDQSQYSSQDQGSTHCIEDSNDVSVVPSSLTKDSHIQKSTSFGQFITQNEFGTALSSALKALTIDPQSEVDSSESKRFIKRSHALRELEATEESYVNDLDVLLHSLDNSLYSTFCELRMRTINEVNKSAGQTTMALLQRESKDLMTQQRRPSTRADLKDFLIKPIQRICRYPLLLKEILRLTNQDDPEYNYIEQCYQIMKHKAREMDENQRVVERRLLTEQFLRKLPDTIFPRKVGIISSKDQLSSSLVGDMSLINNNSVSSGIHPYHTSQTSLNFISGSMGPTFNPTFTSESYFDFSPSLEGIGPSPLTKAFVGTLGSIILAGTMEYVITPDVPVRLKYYGCFLFESMIIVVKAKKPNLYEPKQWLPLRLCELHESSKIDGCTRFGWTIFFDQFRIDFGANSAIEQQIWMQTLQERIKVTKESHTRLPRDVAAFETVVSSLPWRANNSFAPGYTTRTQHQSYQSPLPSPSPWSSCSSAIPSPLMPPPPSASSSTMMMAMSSMVTIEPEKWNSRGSGQTLDAFTYRRESHQYDYSMEQKNSLKPRRSSTGENEPIRIGGMVSNWEPESTELNQGQFQPSSLRPGYDQTRYELQPNCPSTLLPWPLQENRTRNNSFDVTRVFASSSNNIKPNQRAMVQSMFKDVSTEHVWTSTPTVSVISRHSSSNPLNYSQPILVPSSPQVSGSGVFNPTFDPSGSINFSAEDNYMGMGSPSLTSRILRRRSSVIGSRTLQSGGSGTLDKIEYERRRSSTTAAIAGTLSFNFRKNSDPTPQPHRQHRRSSSIVEAGQYGSLSHDRRGRDRSYENSIHPCSPVSSNRSTDNDHDGRPNQGANQSARPPLGVGNDMEALNSVAEAARSRRGNSDRVMKTPGKSLKASSSSHSLPARLRTTNSSALSLLASPLVEPPKDNENRLWLAMGRMIPRRGGGNYEKPLRSGAVAVDTTPSTSTSFHPHEQQHQSHLNLSKRQDQAYFRNAIILDSEEPPLLGPGLLRRASTVGSKSSITSNGSSIPYSDHTRSDSTSTNRSLESEPSPNGRSTGALPPIGRQTLSTSISAPNCTLSSRLPEVRSIFPQDKCPNGTEHQPPLPANIVEMNTKTNGKMRTSDQTRYQYLGQHRQDPLSSNSSKKSLSMLQNFTQSASQKFKTLIRSQNGPRRRTNTEGCTIPVSNPIVIADEANERVVE
ncbi:hypothetical protein BGZ76_011352 [Entomortierella beljakovae]|nr:hypothetical protein BGZ76_011352 [Entomortierella beljakovae]